MDNYISYHTFLVAFGKAIRTSCQMTRSMGKSAYLVKPHIGPSET